MKAIDSIKRALDFIDDHVSEEIRISDLASHCYLSSFYFQRLFHETTGYSVEKYILYRRLACAVTGLQKGERVNKVAEKSGFKSPEHFSRVFKETYKMTPSDYRKEIAPLFHVYKPDVLLQNARLNIGEKYVADHMVLEIQVREQEAISLIGVDMFCPFSIHDTGIDNPGVAWEKFHQVKHTIKHRVQPRHEFGISYNHKKDGYHYLAATVVTHIEDMPNDMVSLVLPKGKYVCCIYENESFEEAVGPNLRSAMIYFEKWFKENKYKTAHNYVIESYNQDAFQAPFRLAIWANVKP